ncbi:MAG: nucleotide disphospho-sugar-binding domain-containing protein [Pseudonocardiaceae bacterium]
MESLYYGVPLVAVPQMPEQLANAGRLVELGLGAQLDAATLTAQHLQDTVTRVAVDPGIRANLDRMREATRNGGGAVRAADLVEKHLGSTC